MALIKFILVFFLFLWLMSKLIGFALRVFLGRVARQNGGRGFTYQKTYQRSSQKQEPRSGDGNVHIDYVPKDKSGKDVDFKGGDYIDYEEVK